MFPSILEKKKIIVKAKDKLLESVPLYRLPMDMINSQKQLHLFSSCFTDRLLLLSLRTIFS